MGNVTCYDCGLEYGGPAWIEAIVPHTVWNLIKPEGCADGAGILCITCMARRIKEARLKNVPMWCCGTEEVYVFPGEPNRVLMENYEPEFEQAE